MKKLAFAALLIFGWGVVLPLSGNPASAQTGGSLANTSWVLAETAVQRAAFVPAVGTPPPTLVFGADGKISGNGGCNSYGGSYTQFGNQLKISSLISTLRACVDDSLNKQEALMFQVLNGQDGTVAFAYNGNTLSFSANAGALSFVPASGGSALPSMPATGRPGPDSPAPIWPGLLLALTSLLLAGGIYLYSRRGTRPSRHI